MKWLLNLLFGHKEAPSGASKMRPKVCDDYGDEIREGLMLGARRAGYNGPAPLSREDSPSPPPPPPMRRGDGKEEPLFLSADGKRKVPASEGININPAPSRNMLPLVPPKAPPPPPARRIHWTGEYPMSNKGVVTLYDSEGNEYDPKAMRQELLDMKLALEATRRSEKRLRLRVAALKADWPVIWQRYFKTSTTPAAAPQSTKKKGKRP